VALSNAHAKRRYRAPHGQAPPRAVPQVTRPRSCLHALAGCRAHACTTSGTSTKPGSTTCPAATVLQPTVRQAPSCPPDRRRLTVLSGPRRRLLRRRFFVLANPRPIVASSRSLQHRFSLADPPSPRPLPIPGRLRTASRVRRSI